MKAYLFILLFLCSAQAVEIVDIEKNLPNIKTKTRFLEMLVALKFIEKPDWKEAESLKRFRDSGDLGLTVISFVPNNSKSITSIAFIGKSNNKPYSDKDFDPDDVNFLITSIVVDTTDKLISYKFDDTLNAYKFSYETIKNEAIKR